MKKKVTIEAIQADVLEKALPDIVFDGWTDALLKRASAKTSYSQEELKTAFPKGVRDLVTAYRRFIDQKMMGLLVKQDIQEMRVRDKITVAVQKRLEVLADYKEEERLAISFWMRPSQASQAVKSVWCTADLIWNFAGDRATDYNRYTKRLLLSSVLSKTTLYWLNDQSENYQETKDFLDRQITSILKMGKKAGQAKKTVDKIWSMTPFARKKSV